MRQLLPIILVAIFVPSGAVGFEWPGPSSGVITGVLGEHRKIPRRVHPRFHNGVDISTPYTKTGGPGGTPYIVNPIWSGVCRPALSRRHVYVHDTVSPNSIQSAGYVHCDARCVRGHIVVGRESPNPPYSQLCAVHDNHLHLIVGEGVAASGDPGSRNPLFYDGGLNGYIDTARPAITDGSLQFFHDSVVGDNDQSSLTASPFPRSGTSIPIVWG